MIIPSELIILRKIFWERRESNPGLLGEKRERYLCAMPTPRPLLVNVVAAAVDVNDSNQFPFSRPYFFFLEKRNFLHFG